MKTIIILTKRELGSFFDSLTAYIMIILFLAFSGFFTWLFGSDIFLTGQASLHTFFKWSYWTLFFFIPGITMKSIAEEIHSGTIEMISTKPVSDWQIVTSKFFSALLLVLIALILTLPYYYSITKLGKIDHGSVLGGYLGLIFISSAYIGIGIFASSISKNQIVAFLISLFISIFFQLIFDLLSTNLFGVVGSILSFLSLNTHFESMARGVIDTRDVIYLISIALAGLLLARHMLSKRLLTN